MNWLVTAQYLIFFGLCSIDMWPVMFSLNSSSGAKAQTAKTYRINDTGQQADTVREHESTIMFFKYRSLSNLNLVYWFGWGSNSSIIPLFCMFFLGMFITTISFLLSFQLCHASTRGMYLCLCQRSMSLVANWTLHLLNKIERVPCDSIH